MSSLSLFFLLLVLRLLGDSDPVGPPVLSLSFSLIHPQAWGFGGKPTSSRTTSHCFPLNGNLGEVCFSVFFSLSLSRGESFMACFLVVVPPLVSPTSSRAAARMRWHSRCHGCVPLFRPDDHPQRAHAPCAGSVSPPSPSLFCCLFFVSGAFSFSLCCSPFCDVFGGLSPLEYFCESLSLCVRSFGVPLPCL